MKNISFVFLLFLFGGKLFAQNLQLKGKITDGKGETLVGVNLSLIDSTNLGNKHFGTTNAKGMFVFKQLSNKNYWLHATYLGYENVSQKVLVSSEITDLGTLKMAEKSNMLKEVQVKAKVEAVTQKGDTLQYKADAYKTHPDATAEELVTKMPGITVENGTLKAHGENIKEVLVDGKPFFGDDPTIAMRNLPAEIIDKIEVFDRLSDQSQFTGVDDGNTIKTLNIVTRSNKQEGQFGKIYGGYGTDDRYSAGGNINLFDKQQRISIIGLANNVNQQNFSNQDLLGVLNSNGGGGSRGGGGGQGGGSSGANQASNFMVGQQSGITTTNALGLNYSDIWGKKLTVRGSYFFNDANNLNGKDLLRQLFLGENVNQYYNESSNSSNHNFNNRANFRFEYTIDKQNSILVTPKFNLQNNNTESSVVGANSLINNELLNKSASNSSAQRHGYTFGNDILFRHKFAKRGRTISFDFGTNLNNKIGNSDLLSFNQYFGKVASQDSIKQHTYTPSNGYQYSGNLVYTEPIGKGLLQMNYNIGISKSFSVKETDKYNPLTHEYDVQDTLLSNKFNNDYLTQRAGMSYFLRNKKLMVNFGVAYQRADLSGQQLYPHNSLVNTTFDNILPSAMMTYNFTQQSRLRIMYRTSTNAPSISQLQNVIDNSNPLFISSGNPNLRQEYAHSVVARYTLTKPKKANSFLALLNATYTQNPISNATTIADKDIVLSNGAILKQGSQLTQPVNLANSWQLRSLVTFGTPLSFIKSNLNLSTGYNFTQSPGLINQNLNTSNQNSLTQGVVLASNVSTKLDFTLSYNINYSKVDNTIQPQLNNKYFTQNTGGKLTWLFGKGFVFQSDITYSKYTGLSTAYNQEYTLWNASFGKKFLKNNSGELKITAFDILKQNNSITRNITDSYIEDSRSQVLQRYFLLTFTYTLRNFKG